MFSAIAIVGIWGSLAVMSYHISEPLLMFALIVGLVATFLVATFLAITID